MAKKHKFIKREKLMDIINNFKFEQNYILRVQNEEEHFFCVKKKLECVEKNGDFDFYGTKMSETFLWRAVSVKDIQMISFYHPEEGYTSCHLI